MNDGQDLRTAAGLVAKLEAFADKFTEGEKGRQLTLEEVQWATSALTTLVLSALQVQRSSWDQLTQNRLKAAMKRIVHHHPQLERLVPAGSAMASIL